MAKKSFHNTLAMSGRDLEKAERKAKSQEQAIMIFWKARPHAAFTPSRLFKRLIKEELIHALTPITSIRRAMTNLTQMGKLEQLETTVKGPLGKPEHNWKITKAEIKGLSTQPSLFK